MDLMQQIINELNAPRYSIYIISILAALTFLSILNSLYAVYFAIKHDIYHRQSTKLILAVVIIETIQALGLVIYLSVIESIQAEVSLLVVGNLALMLIVAIIFIIGLRILNTERKEYDETILG